jgi:uncharacterized protein (UPF0332 family)
LIGAVWLERSERSLKSARIILADGDADSSCSRAYYAIFYAARAALIEAGQAERAMGKTHAGLISAFGEFVVRPGFVDPKYGRIFSSEANRRLVADYDGDGISIEDATITISNAAEFTQAVGAWIATRA